MNKIFNCGGKTLDLSKPKVMGILNVTPDSFSDGGRFDKANQAIDRALQMVEEGADILDIGGESTRPGAEKVSLQQEIDRVVPIIEALTGKIDVPISIDTYKPEVMKQAVAAGAGMINDVKALREEGAMQAAAACDVPICLMHMQGEPGTMQQAPHYDDVVSDVHSFLQQRIASCAFSGIETRRLMIDPGFGFGKNLQHNLSLLKHLQRFESLDVPVLVGMSRKRMLGEILDEPDTDKRLFGGIATSVLAMQQGASIIRVHDVKPTADAVKVFNAVSEAN